MNGSKIHCIYCSKDYARHVHQEHESWRHLRILPNTGHILACNDTCPSQMQNTFTTKPLPITTIVQSPKSFHLNSLKFHHLNHLNQSTSDFWVESILYNSWDTSLLHLCIYETKQTTYLSPGIFSLKRNLMQNFSMLFVQGCNISSKIICYDKKKDHMIKNQSSDDQIWVIWQELWNIYNICYV